MSLFDVSESLQRCAAFDLDGVIADSKRMYIRALAHAMGQAGVPADEEEIAAKITPDVAVWVHAMRQQYGEATTRQVARDARRFISEEGWKLVGPCPGIEPLLDFLKSGHWRTALVTNAPGTYAAKVLDRFGLAAYFEVVISCPERKMSKREGLLHLLGEGGLGPEDMIYIGDTAVDVVHARGAGVGVVVIFNEFSWDYPDIGRVRDEHPDFIAGSFEALIEWLKK
jgi:phosphoglycolate phosphatase